MKKILAMAVCAMFVLTASAQGASNGDSNRGETKDVASTVQVGIRVGMNVSNRDYSYNASNGNIYSDYSEDKALVGYHVGIIVDIPLYKNYFYIQPGVYFTQKGYKCTDSNSSNSSYEYEEKVNPVYLEVPILFSGRYDVSRSVQLQVSFGPYFAAGLAGKFKRTREQFQSGAYDERDVIDAKMFGKYNTNDFKKDENGYSVYKGSMGYKRFDAGLSIGAGALFNRHFFLGFQYEFGLVNMITDKCYYAKQSKENNTNFSYKKCSQKNRNFMLSVGYNF